MHNECPHCNTHNPPQAVTCRVCNLSVPRSNPSLLTAGRALPKLAVFDLDKTVFDLTRRERAAKRQGLKPKGKGWYEFLNQNQYVLMDTAIPGTVSFIKSLSDDGYTIAYLSGRPSRILAATKQSLQESGFPIDATDRDLVFLHSGNQSSLGNLTNHKKTVLTHLKSMFDIHFFFDDTPEFREAAKSLFIPGVYSSISSYTGKEERPSAPKKTRSSKARKNPHETGRPDFYDDPVWGKELSEMTTEELISVEPFYELDIEKAEHLQQEINEAGDSYVLDRVEEAEEEYDELIEEIKSRKPEFMANPPKPRKKRNKAGNMIKEPIKKYMSRLMADPKMNKEFPDNSQRFAVGLSYARKFYGDAKVDKAYPPKSNPGNNTVMLKETPQASKTQLTRIRQAVSKLNYDERLAMRDIPGDSWSKDLFATMKKELTNPAVTQAREYRPVALARFNTHKIHSIDFTQPGRQPFSLPLNMLKKIKSYLHEGREYIGFYELTPKGEPDLLRVGTGFGIGSVGFAQDTYEYLRSKKGKIPVTFHTHPTRKNKAGGGRGLGDIDFQSPSLPDHIATMYDHLIFGTGIEIVVNKYGMHMLRPYINPRSKLWKLTQLPKSKYTKKAAAEVGKILDKEFEKMRQLKTHYNRKFVPDFIEKLRVTDAQLFDLEVIGNMFTETFNDELTALKMEHDFFSYPIAGVQWDKGAKSGEYLSIGNRRAQTIFTNPHNPVTEAKEMYKQFHKKAPSNVKKTKVDIGDTWVGLGKAWSIGYRSGKETGNETQKYIHNFGVDEESGKKFKEPELYYVKNNDGSQMMVIMGGDWYIDVDADGEVSWIYV